MSLHVVNRSSCMWRLIVSTHCDVWGIAAIVVCPQCTLVGGI